MPDQAKIRVMIVDDIAETRENIRRSLQFDSNIEVIGSARSGGEAIQMAQELKPDVVIMDINMPDMDGITATESVRVKVPYCQVVILSVQNDPSYMRRAMLVGARDFLTKPPSIDELIGAIRRAGKVAEEERTRLNQQNQAVASASQQASMAANGKSGKIITVYSPRGGAGTTTVAVNLAISLITETDKVALVDANMQYGDVVVFLNEQPKNSVLDLTPRVNDLDPETVDGVMIKHAATGLRILPAPQRPEFAANVNPDQFQQLLQYLRRVYSYIVINTTSYLTDNVQTALEESDVVVLIATQDIPCIRNCNLFLSLADASMSMGRERIIMMMNRFDRRIGITPERLAENLRQPIPISIPLDDKIIISSVNRGIPFYIEQKNQPLGKCISGLADLCKERIHKLENGPEPAGKK